MEAGQEERGDSQDSGNLRDKGEEGERGGEELGTQEVRLPLWPQRPSGPTWSAKPNAPGCACVCVCVRVSVRDCACVCSYIHLLG